LHINFHLDFLKLVNFNSGDILKLQFSDFDKPDRWESMSIYFSECFLNGTVRILGNQPSNILLICFDISGHSVDFLKLSGNSAEAGIGRG
jgi:hypothetical protein